MSIIIHDIMLNRLAVYIQYRLCSAVYATREWGSFKISQTTGSVMSNNHRFTVIVTHGPTHDNTNM